jgi:hypothetical protein
VAALVAASSLAGPARADSSRQSGTVQFTNSEPNAPTGLHESADYRNPDDPNGKPPPVRQTVVHYAPGVRIDTSVPDQCQASDQQLEASGASACPAGSLIGRGFAEFDTGLPAPAASFDVDLDVLNNQDQVIFLVKPHGTNAVVSVARSTLSGSTSTTDIAAVPGGPPDGQSSVKHIEFATNVVTRMRNGHLVSYMTTPPTCPPSGQWTSSTLFTYADGASQTATAQSPCKVAAATTHPPTAAPAPPSQVHPRHRHRRRGRHAPRHHLRRVRHDRDRDRDHD